MENRKYSDWLYSISGEEERYGTTKLYLNKIVFFIFINIIK